MGACLSSGGGDSSSGAASKKIERMMSSAFVLESEKIKLLLLGAGESGKSTIFKQMRVLFGAPLSDEEKSQVTPVVYSNTIASMKVLAQAVIDMGYENDVSITLSVVGIVDILIVTTLTFPFRWKTKIKVTWPR